MKRSLCLIALCLLFNACALKHTPEHSSAAAYNVQLGLGYLAQNDRMRAREKLHRALMQDPDSIEPHLALAYYYETVGEQIKAQQTYQHALEILPQSGQVNNNYGVFLCSQGDYAQALVYFDRALADTYYPNSASAYENMALCLAKMNHPEAEKYAHLALQQDPKRNSLLLKLSFILAEQKQIARAQAYLDQYHRLSEPTPASMSLARQLSSSQISKT